VTAVPHIFQAAVAHPPLGAHNPKQDHDCYGTNPEMTSPS